MLNRRRHYYKDRAMPRIFTMACPGQVHTSSTHGHRENVAVTIAHLHDCSHCYRVTATVLTADGVSVESALGGHSLEIRSFSRGNDSVILTLLAAISETACSFQQAAVTAAGCCSVVLQMMCIACCQVMAERKQAVVRILLDADMTGSR